MEFVPPQKRIFPVRGSSEVWIRPAMPTHVLRTTLVLLHHLLGSLRLMLVVGRLGLAILLCGAFLHPLHLTLSLAHRTRLLRGTRAEQQQQHQ